MQAQQTAAPRLLRYDAGLLFLWCELLAVGLGFAEGVLIPLETAAQGAILFLIGMVFLYWNRRSETRLRSVMIGMGVFVGLLAYGAFHTATRI